MEVEWNQSEKRDAGIKLKFPFQIKPQKNILSVQNPRQESHHWGTIFEWFFLKFTKLLRDRHHA